MNRSCLALIKNKKINFFPSFYFHTIFVCLFLPILYLFTFSFCLLSLFLFFSVLYKYCYSKSLKFSKFSKLRSFMNVSEFSVSIEHNLVYKLVFNTEYYNIYIAFANLQCVTV